MARVRTHPGSVLRAELQAREMSANQPELTRPSSTATGFWYRSG